MDVRTVFPEQFPWKEWWQSVAIGRPWFYHTPRTVIAEPSGHVDLQSVDPELRDLVQKLHRAGAKTWPSCAGHWLQPSTAHEMFRQLQREAYIIRTVGLPLQHTETGQRTVYYNPTWWLPWKTGEEYYRDFSRGDGRGWLAFTLPPGRKFRRAAAPVRYARRSLGHIGPYRAVVYEVRAPTQKQQREAWRALLHQT